MLESSKSKIVIGVIGLGVGAFHLQNSLAYKNCKVKYICDTNQKKLSYYKKKFRIQNATINFDEVVNDNEVNVIIIASNDDDHYYHRMSILLTSPLVAVLGAVLSVVPLPGWRRARVHVWRHGGSARQELVTVKVHLSGRGEGERERGRRRERERARARARVRDAVLERHSTPHAHTQCTRNAKSHQAVRHTPTSFK